jgi:4-aminobutyrate aminotransferase
MNEEYKFFTASQDRIYPLYTAEMKGVSVDDVDGNRYLDISSGCGAAPLGYSNPELVEAAQEAAAKYAHTGFPHANESTIRLSHKLAEISPGDGEKKVCLGCTGSEAIEGALKLARWYTKRTLFVSYLGGHHGAGTMGSLTASGHLSVWKEGFHPLVPGVIHAPYPYTYRCPLGASEEECWEACFSYLKDSILRNIVSPKDVSCVLIEPMQGPGGFIPAPAEYLYELKQFCEEHDILFIVDEILTGFGKTGKMFAIDHYPKLKPDIVVVGKGLSNGMVPVSAFISSRDIMSWPPAAHSTTYLGYPMGSAISLKTVEIIERENLAERAASLGRFMMKRLKQMQERRAIIGDVRGMGLLIGLELVRDRRTKEPATQETAQIAFRAFQKGLITQWAGTKFNVLTLMPPLTITKGQIEEALEILEESMVDIEKGRSSIPKLPPNFLVATPYR